MKELQKSKRNTEPRPHYADEEAEVQRHGGFALGPQAVTAEARLGGWSSEPHSRSCDWTLALLPRHTMGLLWNSPSPGPYFSIWSSSWENETEPAAYAPSPEL